MVKFIELNIMQTHVGNFVPTLVNFDHVLSIVDPDISDVKNGAGAALLLANDDNALMAKECTQEIKRLLLGAL